MINTIHFKTFSPLPQTQLFGASLLMKQLSWGIEIQRYETFVGAISEYPIPLTIFTDPDGGSILARSGLGPFPLGKSDSVLTLSESVSLVVKHPLDFFVLYLHHLCNGLDVVYSTPYVYDLYKNTVHIRLINYSLWFLVILFISKFIKATAIFTHQFLLLLIFITSAIASIPTAMETRFMLPFHLIAYSIVAFYVIPLFGSFPRKKQVDLILKYALWYIAFVSLCFTLSSNTFSNLEHGTYIFWK